MEVDRVSFYPLLLDILTDISESHFVTFDLELSGIPSKVAKNGKGAGRQTLQERYAEVKQAAERYQILQIGLTCVQQDVEHKKYILKPYNFELSPLIEERGLDIERIFSFQSGAVDFLLKVGFDLSVPFKHGIPYLSRAESKEAREKHAKRQDKSAIADIQIKPTETESLAFLERVRDEINTWIKSRKHDALDYLNIGAMGADVISENGETPLPQAISRFEMRLVHQLVRAEYPELVSIGKRGFVQIVRYDEERESRIQAERKRELYERIGRQKGFRWVIEALHGSEISNLDLRECARDPVTGDHVFADMNEFKAQFNRAHALLRGNPRVLIGHNCFLDLVYIYHTFIGELPDTVEEFQQELHHLWPVIVDTKYMSTHECGDINPVSSLEQIASQLSAEQEPILEIEAEHMKYANVEALHEAGYDSFLTAQIAARLSTKLVKDGTFVEVNGKTNGHAKTVASNGSLNENIARGVHNLQLTETALDAHTYHVNNGTTPLSDADSFMPSVEGGKWKRRGDPTLPPQNPQDPFKYNPKNLKHRLTDDDRVRSFEGGMPGFDSDFWRVYGNKLRVFGTEEGVCVLSERVVNSSDEDEEVGVGQGGVVVA